MPGFADVVGNLPPLPELILWRDPVARSAAEAMAVDEALLEWGEFPVLRIYRWGEPAVTFGYFDEEGTARRIFPGEELHFVRRWTGGGIVDHRQDIPFTLAMHRRDGAGAPFKRHLVPVDSRGAGPRAEGLRRGVRDAGRGRARWRPRLFFQPRDQ